MMSVQGDDRRAAFVYSEVEDCGVVQNTGGSLSQAVVNSSRGTSPSSFGSFLCWRRPSIQQERGAWD
ncbi:unnamed protein product [Calypogeia fissa]